MPPTERFLISFAAEPPHEPAPYGAWGERLSSLFLAACDDVDTEGEDVGTPGTIRWYPDRTFGGWTYVPATARTDDGYEFYGYVSFKPLEGREPEEFEAHADFTSELAENNPDWRIDLNDWVIGHWRGEGANVADMTLVWGMPQIPSGALVTAELAGFVVDQCPLIEERFTLIAPDNYRGDYLDVKLWNGRAQEIAAESLYVEDTGDESDELEAGADANAGSDESLDGGSTPER